MLDKLALSVSEMYGGNVSFSDNSSIIGHSGKGGKKNGYCAE